MLLLLLKCVFLVFVFKGKYRMGKKHMNYVYLFFKAKLGLFFVYFRPFLNTMTNIVQNLTIMEEAKIMCLGFEPRTAGWWAQTNPLSFRGPTRQLILLPYCIFCRRFHFLMLGTF